MEQCKQCRQCRQYRSRLNEDGVCIFCSHGPGGRTTKKKSRSEQQCRIGKAIKSAVTSKWLIEIDGFLKGLYVYNSGGFKWV